MASEESEKEYCREGEVCTSFEDVAEEMAKDPKLQRAGSSLETIRDRILGHLDTLTIADILREAIKASDMEEVESLIEIMKDEAH